MQPNEQPQHPIDYLNEISPPPKNSGGRMNDRLFFGVIIAALVTALLVGVIAFVASRDDGGANLSTLSVRLNNLQTIADDSQKHIVSSSLRGTNTSLALVL